MVRYYDKWLWDGSNAGTVKFVVQQKYNTCWGKTKFTIFHMHRFILIGRWYCRWDMNANFFTCIGYQSSVWFCVRGTLIYMLFSAWWRRGKVINKDSYPAAYDIIRVSVRGAESHGQNIHCIDNRSESGTHIFYNLPRAHLPEVYTSTCARLWRRSAAAPILATGYSRKYSHCYFHTKLPLKTYFKSNQTWPNAT